MFCSLLGHANKAQQAFSSACAPTLFNAIPAIELLHAAWNNHSKKLKYSPFHKALNVASKKLNEYYEKTADSDAHIFAMLLHPTKKMSYFKKHWDQDLQDDVLTLAKKIFKERYNLLSNVATRENEKQPPQKKQKTALLRMHNSDSDKSDCDNALSNPSQSWIDEFQRYLNTTDILPDDMTEVEWWGVSHINWFYIKNL
ncbi:hypothetical protein BDZ94DRAFT_1353562 [Collybia nuda]|uniref:Uncharacterized protein n=1 Tax=Collybia nuda TaxID=64659 RepID=A0A9P6CG33_9AGAR|nr:hypothetical protein BDZ94DRAFT_1353562 [Collybia nuda]